MDLNKMLEKISFKRVTVEIISLCLIVLGVGVIFLNQINMDFIFNADVLTIPEIIKDLSNAGHIRDWHIPTTSTFFPDWIIAYISHLFTKNIYYQLLIIANISTILMYIMLRNIYSQFFGRNKEILYSLISIGILLFLFSERLQPYIFILVTSEHAGEFIIGLLYLSLQIKSLNKHANNSKIILILALYTMAFLMGISDVLFAVHFLIPIFLVYLFLFFKKKLKLDFLLTFSVLPVLFFTLGLYLLRYVTPRTGLWWFIKCHFTQYNFYEIYSNNTLFIIENLKTLFKSSELITILFFIFWILVITIFTLFSFKKFNNIKNKIHINNCNIFLSSFLIFSSFFNFLIFIFLVKAPTLRYIEPLFFFPIIFLFFLDNFFCKNKKISEAFVFLASIVSLLLITNLVLKFDQLKMIKKDFYPKELACVDNALANEDKYGVANYWTARPFSMFSHKELKISPITGNLLFFLSGSTINNNRSTYSFAIIDMRMGDPTWKLNQKLIEDINGLPNKIVICGSQKLLIYPKNRLKIFYIPNP
jgi:hypothetical protein